MEYVRQVDLAKTSTKFFLILYDDRQCYHVGLHFHFLVFEAVCCFRDILFKHFKCIKMLEKKLCKNNYFV